MELFVKSCNISHILEEIEKAKTLNVCMYVCMYTIIFTYDGYHIQQKQTDEINYYKEENSRLEKQVFHSCTVCMYLWMYVY